MFSFNGIKNNLLVIIKITILNKIVQNDTYYKYIFLHVHCDKRETFIQES